MHDARELAKLTMEYLEVGRAVLDAQGNLTRRHSELIDRALEPLAIIAQGDPDKPRRRFRVVSNRG